MPDADSFDAFYRATYDRTFRYLYGVLGDAGDAQDATQEAYGRAWRAWRDVGAMADPEAWVRTVGWRVAANHLRRLRSAARRRPPRPDQAADVGTPGADTVDLVSALRRIDRDQRRALVLHYLLDLPVQQVADETGVSVSAAKARLVRGRAALGVLLRLDEEPGNG